MDLNLMMKIFPDIYIANIYSWNKLEHYRLSIEKARKQEKYPN
jgi:hypothetical protein